MGTGSPEETDGPGVGVAVPLAGSEQGGARQNPLSLLAPTLTSGGRLD